MQNNNFQRILSRLESLIEEGKHVLTTVEPRVRRSNLRKRDEPDGEYADSVLHLKFVVSSLYFIASTVGRECEYYKEFESLRSGITEKPIKMQVAILEALHVQLRDVWYWSMQGLASAQVFSGMLEEAGHLLDKGFKVPATVLAGCVIETHLRDLCKKHDLTTEHVMADGSKRPKKPAQLNQDLFGADVYNINDSKEINTYLGFRNSAAHGKDTEFDVKQIHLMLQGVLAFIGRNPI